MKPLALSVLVSLFLVPALLTAQTSAERSVATRINAELDRAFSAPGNISVSTRIQTALHKVTTKREEPGQSTDPLLRDVEYYLHGLYGASANDWAHVTPTIGAPIYNAIKWVACRCRDAGRPGLEEWLRTNPENPVSEPGGSLWAYRGLKDGWSVDGKQVVPPKATGHGLTLGALAEIAPCVPPPPPKLGGTKWALTWDTARTPTTIFPIEFRPGGRLSRINPANGVDDAGTGIVNTWKQSDADVTFSINSGYTTFTGTFDGTDAMTGEARTRTNTWKWRADRRR